jgi:hypothetical protein
VEVEIRGIVAETIVMQKALSKGGSFNVLLEEQFVYQREKVQGRVDPNDLIPEEDDNNNALSKELLPDVPVDLAVVGVAAVGLARSLAVDIANTTVVPILAASITITALDCDTASKLTAMDTQIELAPLETLRVEVFPPIVALEGLCVRITLDVKNIADADLSNNDQSFVVP